LSSTALHDGIGKILIHHYSDNRSLQKARLVPPIREQVREKNAFRVEKARLSWKSHLLNLLEQVRICSVISRQACVFKLALSLARNTAVLLCTTRIFAMIAPKSATHALSTSG
jgi:hypothetical protein